MISPEVNLWRDQNFALYMEVSVGIEATEVLSVLRDWKTVDLL